MQSDPAIWGPFLIAIVVAWLGSGVLKVLQIAAVERREDHREMMQVLEEIARDISNLEASVNGLALRYDPPNLSDYE